jgi:hypothetical protein
VIAWLVLLIFAVVGGIGQCIATTLGNGVGIGEYRDPRDAACKMTVSDVVVLGRSGGFGSGLNFRRFERIDDDHAGGGVEELGDGEKLIEGKKKGCGMG